MSESRKHTNDFHKSIALEDKYDNIFIYLYEQFFYKENIQSIEKIISRDRQMRGIDYIVTLKNGREVFIDNKVREKWYGDILLEEYSNYESQRLWWLLREDVETEYIFYFIASINTCIVFRHDEAKEFVINNYDLLEQRRKLARNSGYHTSNFPVTLKELESVWVNYMVIEA